MNLPNRPIIAAGLGLGALLPGFARAQDVPEPAALIVSGNVALVSDYRLRGVSQSGGNMAVQAALEATHESGFHAGVWASSVSFGKIGTAPIFGSAEVDLTGGWSREIASGLTADLGLTYYAYPDGHVGRANFFETYGALATTYGPVRLKAGANYAWAQGALGGRDNLYLHAGADAAIPATPVTLNARLGWQDGPRAGAFLAGGGTRTHNWDWSLGAAATVRGGFTLGASYVGTSGPALGGVTDDTVVASLSFAF